MSPPCLSARYSWEQKAGLRTADCLQAALCFKEKFRPGRWKNKEEKQNRCREGEPRQGCQGEICVVVQQQRREQKAEGAGKTNGL